LLNRPDLRAFRNELIAADAEIGQAIAERLPRITLDGSFFTETVRNLPDLQERCWDRSYSRCWTGAPARRRLNAAVPCMSNGWRAFSQAYLQAIENVENTLYQERKQREFLDRLERRRAFLERTVEETRDRYTNGLTDFLPVLDAIKELQRIERIIVRQERALLGFRIQLHRALGGRV
jgi:outer membrane protein TolC